MTNLISIDFGTMRTKLAYIDFSRNKPEVMRLGHDDKPYIPSIFYLGKDGKRLFGDAASDFLEDDPIGFLRRPLKRDLREPWVRAGNREKATPIELLTLLIGELRERAKALPAFYKQIPSSLYLTIPVQYGPPDERVLLEAAHGAGFDEGMVHFVKEPVSAAQAWLSELGGAEEFVVVLDCGGGTLDWACLHKTKSGEFEIVVDPPPGGDNKVGGYNIDDNIYELIKDRTEDEAVLKELEERSSYVRDQIRIIKEKYSRSKVGGRIKMAGTNIEIVGAELESIIQNRFINQVCDNFKPYLSNVKNKLKLTNPSVLLVGGSSRIRGLKEALQERGKCNPIWWERSDYATVLGAILVNDINKVVIIKSSDDKNQKKKNDKSINIKNGIDYLEKGKYNEALNIFDKLVQSDSENVDLLNYIGQAYFHLDKNKEAIEAYKKSIELNPDDPDLQYNIGLAYLDNIEYSEAIEAFRNTIRLKSNDIEAYKKLGSVYNYRNQYKDEIDLYKMAISIFPHDPDLYYKIALGFYNINEYEQAMEFCRSALDIEPKHFNTNNILSRIYYELEQFDKSLMISTNIIKMYPERIEPYRDLGYIYYDLKKYNQANRSLQKYLKVFSDDADAYYLLGCSYQNLERYNDAINVFKKSINIDENNAEVYLNMGLSFYSLRDYGEAIKALLRSIKLEPKSYDAHHYLGLSYYDSELYSKAIKAFEKAVSLNPESEEVSLYIGDTFCALQQYDDAIEIFQNLIHSDPNNPEFYYKLGITYSCSEQYDDAIKAYKQVIQINTNYEEVWLNIGFAYEATENYKQAINSYKNSILHNQNPIGAHFNLGIVFNKIGNKSMADKELKALEAFDTTVANENYNIYDIIYYD